MIVKLLQTGETKDFPDGYAERLLEQGAAVLTDVQAATEAPEQIEQPNEQKQDPEKDPEKPRKSTRKK